MQLKSVVRGQGLHVLMFSDNVPVEDEVRLRKSRQRLADDGTGRGTAIINGVALAFANAVKRGDIGIVGAQAPGHKRYLSDR